MGEAPLTVWREDDGRLLRLRLGRPKANIVDAEMIAADLETGDPGAVAAADGLGRAGGAGRAGAQKAGSALFQTLHPAGADQKLAAGADRLPQCAERAGFVRRHFAPLVK